jgi:hypothetical protein
MTAGLLVSCLFNHYTSIGLTRALTHSWSRSFKKRRGEESRLLPSSHMELGSQDGGKPEVRCVRNAEQARLAGGGGGAAAAARDDAGDRGGSDWQRISCW